MASLTSDTNPVIEQISTKDNSNLKRFIEDNPDGGRVAFQPHYKVGDIFGISDLQRHGTVGFAAYNGTPPTLTGVIYAWPHSVNYNDQNVQAILLGNLSVAMQYRKQGLATALLNHAIEWAKAQFGQKDLVIYGYIQSGNAGSERACAKAGGRIDGRSLWTLPAKVISTEKADTDTIREVTAADLEIIAEGLNQFYRAYDLYQVQTAQTLAAWLAPKKIDDKLLKLANYYVITDAHGEIQAGAGVFNGPALYNLKIVKAPGLFRLANRFLKIVGPDGFLSPLPVSRLWYKPNQLELAKILWKEIRKREGNRGRTLTVSFDPHGPLTPLLRPLAFMPVSKLQLVVFHQPGLTSPNKALLAGYEF